MESNNNPNSADDKGPGAAVKDFLPIPATNPGEVDSGRHDFSSAPDDQPTFSHTLAVEAPDDAGHAQQPHGRDVLDLGWNEKKEDIAAPLVGGMDNEELWMLIRRFNKAGYLEPLVSASSTY